MPPEIIRLLDLGPNASAGQIRRAYKKHRKEISPELTRELERLDAAYAEFTGRKAEVYSEEQLRAMHFLGFVPGCSLKEAEKLALDRGKDETEIRKASALLAPLQPKTGPGRIISFALWKILAFLPFLLVFPIYKLILDSGVNFFPGHSDPELAEWFSGTLLASATVSVLFTVTVPLLLSAILRRRGSKKRLFRKLGILPASPSLKQDLSAELDLLLVFTALVLTITGPQFYRNTVDYLADYRDMKNENYLSVQLFAPDHVPNGRRYSSLGSLISDGGGLVLDVRDALYDNSSIGSKNGDIHETVYHYLPRTKLVHHADVRSWRLTNWRHRSTAERYEFIPPLTEPDLEYDPVYGTLEDYGKAVSNRSYVWRDEQRDVTFALFSYTQQTLSRSAVRAVVLDKDGRPLHEHILTGKCIGEAFMLHNGDIILYTSGTLKDPWYSGASVQAVRLSGRDLSLLSQSKSTELQPYRKIHLGKVGTDGIDITITKNVHDPSSETTGKRHYFLSIP